MSLACDAILKGRTVEEVVEMSPAAALKELKQKPKPIVVTFSIKP